MGFLRINHDMILMTAGFPAVHLPIWEAVVDNALHKRILIYVQMVIKDVIRILR